MTITDPKTRRVEWLVKIIMLIMILMLLWATGKFVLGIFSG